MSFPEVNNNLERVKLIDLKLKITEAKEFGRAYVENYFSMEQAKQICVDIFGNDFSNVQNYKKDELGYAAQPSSQALSRVVDALTLQIHNAGMEDWEPNQVDVKWYRDVGQNEHTDQTSLKDILAILNLYGEADVAFYDESGRVTEIVTMKTGDMLLLREKGEHGETSLPHSVTKPKGLGLRLIGLVAYLEGGKI